MSLKPPLKLDRPSTARERPPDQDFIHDCAASDKRIRLVLEYCCRKASGPEEWTLDAVRLGEQGDVFERVSVFRMSEAMVRPRLASET